MYSKIVFKEVFEYDTKKITKLKSKSFFEIKHEPTYDKDKILFCNKSDLTFDEVINILEKTKNSISILGAMSFVYYKYCSQFYSYISNLEDKNKKMIIMKTKKYFKRWNILVATSDDLLYPQNEIIKKICNTIYQI